MTRFFTAHPWRASEGNNAHIYLQVDWSILQIEYFKPTVKVAKIISCYDAIHYFKGRWIKSNLRCCLRQVRNKVECMGIFCRWNSKTTFGSQEAIYYHQPHKKSIYNSSLFIQCISNKFIWILQQHLRQITEQNYKNEFFGLNRSFRQIFLHVILKLSHRFHKRNIKAIYRKYKIL